MADISKADCKRLADARRRKGMTQSAVAAAVGCRQSAICMLEGGQSGKLAADKVAKIAELLEVKLETVSENSVAEFKDTRRIGFCPNAECHSNVPYVSGGVLYFWPVEQQGDRCVYCGEVLEHNCPNCGASLVDGACCPACGEPKVVNTLPPETDFVRWAAERRVELAEWRQLKKK